VYNNKEQLDDYWAVTLIMIGTCSLLRTAYIPVLSTSPGNCVFYAWFQKQFKGVISPH